MGITRIVIIGTQLNRLAESLNSNPSVWITGVVALIAAVIGASAAIGSQIIIFNKNRAKEDSNLKRQLVAEERRIAYLLTEYYKELVMYKVHKQYWYRTSIVFPGSIEELKDSHSKHFVSNDKSFETLNKIRVETSEYFKTVTLFTNLVGENEIIFGILNDVKAFRPRKANGFDEVNDYEQLLIEQPIEEDSLNKEYLYYSVCYDKINTEMTKRIG